MRIEPVLKSVLVQIKRRYRDGKLIIRPRVMITDTRGVIHARKGVMRKKDEMLSFSWNGGMMRMTAGEYAIAK